MRIENDVLTVLARAQTDGNALRLVGQLDRKLYERVNKVLEAAGGKWNRKAKAHLYEGGAAEAMEQIILTGEARAVTGTGGMPRRTVDEVRPAGVVSQPHEGGRWPANVLHDGSDAVAGIFPAEAGAFAPVHRRSSDKTRNSYGTFKGDVDEQGSTFHGDRGSAARFFWCPKASRRDRNDGLHGEPRQAVNWSSGEQSPGTFQSPNTDRLNENFHPTVKPTALMQYLCRLVTPRGGGSPRSVHGKRQHREGSHA